MSAPIERGASLAPLVNYYDQRGWQLVACQWHTDPKTKRSDTTPISGITGGQVPFLTGDSIHAKTRGLVLHPEGGPECTGSYAKPAVRTPLHVVGFDVDHGYGGKTGGDTLVNAEMQLGPLPGSWSLTARGPYQPSRRIFYRKPADLVIRDEFFREFGGCIEIIRTGHRYSWTWPAAHVKKGRVVGPVLWYDCNHQVTEPPRVDDLPELPPAWIKRGYELMAAAQKTEHTSATGQAQLITVRHADAIVNKTLRTFMGPPYLEGGDFRNAVFGLATNITRRAVARGHGPAEVRDEMAELFAQHPTRSKVGANDRDLMWIEDGITRGMESPWYFEVEVYAADGTLTEEAVAALWATYPERCSAADAAFRDSLLDSGHQIEPEPVKAVAVAPDSATDAELDEWLATYISHHAPGRLRKRIEWMSSGNIADHAYMLVADSIYGYYPAKRAVQALSQECRARGHTDPKTVERLLAAALGAVLNAKVGAR
jgi:hypothetical protein